jgi:hypothetical protein
VAPLLTVARVPRLVGTVTVVANGERVIGVTSAEVVRQLATTPLQIATKLDGSATLAIAACDVGRYTGIALVELAGKIPDGHDVVPLPIGAVHATANTHGAPSALVTIRLEDGSYRRMVIDVDVDADDGGGMSDHVMYLASPTDPAHVGVAVEGAPAFAWLPQDPALGRKREVVVFALAYPYGGQRGKPRALPVLAELVPLDDLGRALMVTAPEPADDRPALVTGEIVE